MQSRRSGLGRHTEPISVAEVPDPEKAPVLRACLDAWAWEVGSFFEGVDAEHATTEDLTASAPGFPVFRIL